MKLVDLVRDEGFRAGFAAGLVAMAALGAVALVARRPVPLAGLAVAGAALVALDRSTSVPEVPRGLVAGLAALAASGLVPARTWWLRGFRLVATVPGALLVAGAIDIGISWAEPFTVVTTVVGAALVCEFDRGLSSTGLGPLAVAFTVLGVYACVPDTEEAVVIAGSAIPLALLGWPKPLASLGAPGASAVVGLVVWVAAVDGRGRSGAIVGATACLGVMLLEPLVRATRNRQSPRRFGRMRSVLAIGGTHLTLVGVCSRVAGLQMSPGDAAVVATLAFIVAAIVLHHFR